MASETLNLGNFARFPQEVRDMIWANLAPRPRYQTQVEWDDDENDDNDEADTEPGSLGIIQACHRLHEEILPLIYQKEVLQINVAFEIIHNPLSSSELQQNLAQKQHLI